MQAIDVSGVGYVIDDRTLKYALRKIGRLDRFLPRHARKSAAVDIRLKQVNRDHGNKYEAEAVLHIPGKVVTAKDSTVNMMAAIDIVEAKMSAQLVKYKQATEARKKSTKNVA